MQFDAEEFQSRIQHLRVALRARNLDALLIDDNEITAYYLNYETGLTYYRAGIIPVEGEPFFVLRAVDVEPMRAATWITDVHQFPDGSDVVAAFAQKVRERGLADARIGVDLTSHALTAQTFDRLKSALPTVEFVDVDGLPWKLRKLKSPAEIEKVRRASAVADATMHEILDAVKVGFTEREAVGMAAEGYVRRGADPGDPGVITVAKGGWGHLHGNIVGAPLQRGDVLHVELLPSVEGYSARIMRNVVVGEIPPELEALSRKMIEIQDEQIAAMKAGAIAKDIDRIMRQGSLDAGIREEYTNVTGYTLGYYSHRMMRGSDFTWVFLPTSEWFLEEGMVFHMYTSGGGIAISETVLVGAAGGERLTKTERRLFCSAEGASQL